jgi:murein DD-endopeptidase MepM/ murein hydrolase activator NlpD
VSPRDRASAGLELGVEPPIRLGDEKLDRTERRRASLRWLVGAALTGLSGVALIGAALYFDLDIQPNFAEAPEFAGAASSEAGEEGVSAGKGDRLLRPIDIVADKQTFKVPTTIKIGDKEVVKQRAFTRLQTALSLTPNEFADAAPPFNPLKLMNRAETADVAPVDPGPVQDDAEVTFRTQEITAADAEQAAGDLTLAEAQAQVVVTLKALPDVPRAPPSLPAQLLLMRTSQAAATDPIESLSSYATVGAIAPSAPFASIEVRMIPENVTNVARTINPEDATPSEKVVQLHHGESFDDLLRANGADADAVSAIIAAFGAKKGEPPVGEGQKILLLPEEPAVRGAKPRIARVSVYSDGQLKATVALTDSGAYAPVLRDAQNERRPKPSEIGDSGAIGLYQSLYETTLKQKLPKALIDVLTRVFVNDVDFQRGTSPGDSVEAFYSEPDDINPHPELLYATMTVRDQTFRYYRFQTPDDNMIDYFDENGRSTRKFLMRKPIADGEITSGFGMRYHPILHFTRMHTGVDWAAPIGTPILAAGNGVVIKAEWDSGYGRRVEIQHANGYVTTYNHMSGFGRGIADGVRVTQGQVVGYLGQTGLATGPHLHYEVIINGNFVDPMAIKLARTREFDGKMLAAFRRERDRIDQLLAQAPAAAASATEKPAPGATAKLN